MDEVLRLFSRAGDGVWAVDSGHHIVLWNQAAEELLGHTTEEAVEQLCYQLVAGQDLGGKPFCKAGCSVMECAQRMEPVRGFDLVVRCRDGKALRVSVSIITVPESFGVDAPDLVMHIVRPIGEGRSRLLPLRIHLLGHTIVQRADGSLVESPLWRRVKVRALLAFLALHNGEAVHRDTLIAVLWPDLEYLAALHNLNTTIYNLRRSLEPRLERRTESSYIFNEGDFYLLNDSPPHWLDVEAFEAGIAQARRESDRDRAIRQYRDALTLYQGDFLADLGLVNGWCWQEQRRLRELFVNALEELGTLYEQRQDYRHASEVYLKALANDPCRETVCQRLMRLLMRRGDRAAVVAYYHSLIEALQRELGICPSRETRLIYEAAVLND